MEGIANWRDVGAAPDSGIAPGRLFRSGHLADATKGDLERLATLGITTLVDLRRPHERAAQPSPSLGAGVKVIASDLGDAIEPPHIAFLRQAEVTPQTTQAYLLDYYRRAPFQPRHRQMFAAMFDRWNSAPGAMLIHCTAGKDRTGLAVALLQSVEGVASEAIRAEYLRSNLMLSSDASLERGRRYLETLLGHMPPDFVVRAFLGVDEEHLAAALSGIEAHSGALSAYIAALKDDL